MKIFVWVAWTVMAAQAKAAVIRGGGCAPTAEAAVARLLANATSDEETVGFRVDAVRTDKLQGRSWAMVASCTEPAKPRVAIALPGRAGMAASVAPAAVMIHAGDRVTVWSVSGDSHMELTGWAEEAGGEKQMIRVRLGMTPDGSHAATTLRCEVLEAGVVEVVR